MPLLSLIEDNLGFVRDLGISACSLSAAGNAEGRGVGQLYQEMRALRYKIVYVTPEKIASSPGLQATMDELYGRG